MASTIVEAFENKEEKCSKSDIETIAKKIRPSIGYNSELTDQFAVLLFQNPNLLKAYQINPKDLQTEHFKSYCWGMLRPMLADWRHEKENPGSCIDEIQEELLVSADDLMQSESIPTP